MSYWWCLTHERVEEGIGCANINRLGPYDTEQEAAGAPARTAARTRAIEAEEAAEDDWGSSPGWSSDKDEDKDKGTGAG